MQALLSLLQGISVYPVIVENHVAQVDAGVIRCYPAYCHHVDHASTMMQLGRIIQDILPSSVQSTPRIASARAPQAFNALALIVILRFIAQEKVDTCWFRYMPLVSLVSPPVYLAHLCNTRGRQYAIGRTLHSCSWSLSTRLGCSLLGIKQ